MHVTDQVTLNGEGFRPVLIVGEGQVRLVVQDTHRGRVDLVDETGGVGCCLGHRAEVIFDAEHHVGVLRLLGKDAEGCAELFPVGGVVGAFGLPGACVDPDPGGSHGVRGVEASAELVDAFLPTCRIGAVDGGGVGGERNDRDTFGGGDSGCLLRGSLI